MALTGSGVRAAAIVAVLGALCGVTGCGSGGSNGDAIESAITAVVKGHDCSRLTTGARRSLTGDASVARCSHDLAARVAVHSLKFTTVTAAGENATAKVSTDGHAVTLGLVKQNGKWLIADIGG